MANKVSDWKIIATEGATVDGRTISPSWINEMADSYSLEEYGALVWPEHSRDNYDVYNGSNWGEVIALKAEMRAGKLRLLAKIAPNALLLSANSNGQKIYTSIEPEPNYQGKGTCYLMGLAVTDSPASSGTTRLRFSRSNGKETYLECSHLEEIDFSECDNSSLVSNAFHTLARFFQTGGQLPGAENKPQEEEPMNKEQFEKIEGTLASIVEKQETQQTKLDEFSTKLTAFSKQAPTEAKPAESAPEGETPENKQFSEVTTQLQTITESISSLQSQFKDLTKEAPGQENAGEGASTKVEAL